MTHANYILLNGDSTIETSTNPVMSPDIGWLEEKLHTVYRAEYCIYYQKMQVLPQQGRTKPCFSLRSNRFGRVKKGW